MRPLFASAKTMRAAHGVTRNTVYTHTRRAVAELIVMYVLGVAVAAYFNLANGLTLAIVLACVAPLVTADTSAFGDGTSELTGFLALGLAAAILGASGGIEFGDGVQLAPGVHIATINHDFAQRHAIYTYGKVTIKRNAWLGMGVTVCPGVTIGAYAVVGVGAVVTKDIPDYAVAVGTPAKVIKYLDPADQKE